MIKSKYNINTKLNDNKSIVIIDISYKDVFVNEKYNLKGIVEGNKIKFNTFKNKNKLKEVSFVLGENFENNTFLKDLNNSLKDYDLIEDFKKNHFENFNNELSEYIKKSNSSVILNNNLIEGYKEKLQGMSGIKKINHILR